MTRIAASAPGKVVLSGEYAVLRDAPAICMALDRRAIVSATASDDDCHTLVAPGYRQGQWRFRHAEDGIRWLDSPPEPDCFALFERLWLRVLPAPAQCWSLSLDSRAFFDIDSGRKLGLGASAAIAVALSAVLNRIGGTESAAATCAADGHRDYQGGRGSGVDIATSVHGGVIEFQRARAGRPQRLGWPRGLHCDFFWSGHSASTADKLQKLVDARDPCARRGGELQRQARAVAEMWRGSDCRALLKALRAYTSALQRFDVDGELGIFDAGHAELADAAPSLGVVYKPCGAGGGDIGAAFAPGAEALEEFSLYAAARGFKELHVSLDVNGVNYGL